MVLTKFNSTNITSVIWHIFLQNLTVLIHHIKKTLANSLLINLSSLLFIPQNLRNRCCLVITLPNYNYSLHPRIDCSVISFSIDYSFRSCSCVPTYLPIIDIWRVCKRTPHIFHISLCVVEL